MKMRDLASSVMWSLMPFVHVLQFLGHGLMWLALSCIRKIFQIKFQTGYSSLVLLERSHQRSSLMYASLVVFRMRRGLANLRYNPDTTWPDTAKKSQSPA